MASRIGGVLLTNLPAIVNGKSVDRHNIGPITYTPAAKYPSSSSSEEYCVCEISDGTTSCDCKGWTRRAPPTGRTCKHTEDYLMYLQADWQALQTHSAPHRFSAGGTQHKATEPVAVPVEVPVQAKEGTKGGRLADMLAKMAKADEKAVPEPAVIPAKAGAQAAVAVSYSPSTSNVVEIAGIGRLYPEAITTLKQLVLKDRAKGLTEKQTAEHITKEEPFLFLPGNVSAWEQAVSKILAGVL